MVSPWPNLNLDVVKHGAKPKTRLLFWVFGFLGI